MNRNQKHIQALLDLATAGEQAEGQTWYRRANTAAVRLADQYEVPIPVAAGVIAALSPRNKWKRNLIDAENLIAVYKAAGAEAAEDVKVCTFGRNKAKAIEILQLNEPVREEQVLGILSGPKLQEFYGCIIGVHDEVCIDGHAYSIWAGDRITLANVPNIGKKLREKIKVAYCRAAQEVDVTPAQMQAITWCAWRRIHGVN